MSDINASIAVNAAPEKIYAISTDIVNSPKVSPDIVRTELLTPGAFGVGTRWRETRKAMGREGTVELTVTECRPNAGYTVTCEVMGTKYTTRFDIRAAGAGSTIDVGIGMECKGLMAKMAAAAVKGPMRSAVLKDLERLKIAAEKA